MGGRRGTKYGEATRVTATKKNAVTTCGRKWNESGLCDTVPPCPSRRGECVDGSKGDYLQKDTEVGKTHVL